MTGLTTLVHARRRLLIVLTVMMLALLSTVTPRGLPAGGLATPAVVHAAAPSDRYAIFIMGSDGNPAWAPMMGLSWVIGPGPGNPLPAGVRSLYGLPANPVLPESTLRSLVAQRPAAHWYIENEPNVTAGSSAGIPASVDTYAKGLNYYARMLKGLDRNAKLLGPNILNWDFTCIGCQGYATGRDWTIQMRDRYRALYSSEPPLDIWTIHTYDLDWVNLPQGNVTRQIAQVQGMRTWLDGIRALRRTPIWVTEVGYHWNYPGYSAPGDGKLYPAGPYAVAHLDQWMRGVFGWFNTSAQQQQIDRWFITLAYTEDLEPWMGGDRWPGITLLDGPLAAPTINQFGRLYQQLAGVTGSGSRMASAGATPPAPRPVAQPRPATGPIRTLPCALRPQPC